MNRPNFIFIKGDLSKRNILIVGGEGGIKKYLMRGGVLMRDQIREKGILKYAAAKANIPNLHVGCRQAYQANQGEVKFCRNIIFGFAAGEVVEDALHQGLRGTGGRMTAFVKIRAVQR